MSEARKVCSRSGGRKARRAARAHPIVSAAPYLTRRAPVYEVPSAEGLEIIEDNAESIIEQTGVDFRDDEEALVLWREAGASIDGSVIDPAVDEVLIDYIARRKRARTGTG